MAMETDLPISEILPQLSATFEDHLDVVLEAPPGAGKTTIVPLHLLTAPWLEYRKILVLEPRRLAARTAALQVFWPRTTWFAVSSFRAELGVKIAQTLGKVSAVLPIGS